MIQAQTPTNAVPVSEPNKVAPTTGPEQSEAEKKAAADKAKANSNIKS